MPDLSPAVFHDFFQASRSLRVLTLSSYCINALPPSFSFLQQLRYLDFSSSSIVKLPEQVGYLYNLETLRLSNCKSLTSLAENMQNLTRLEHLDLNETPALEEMPPEFGKLTRLQLLTNFVVGNNCGSRISALKDLSLLRTLSISRLQNVSLAVDAAEANLNGKKYLHELNVSWDRNAQYAEDVNHVLRYLKPGDRLEKLNISNFCGSKWPYWLEDDSFSQMKYVALDNCPNCKSFPPLGQLPSLKELKIKNLPGVVEVGPQFYGSNPAVAFKSLEKLQFEEMTNWRLWSVNFTNLSVFPRLQMLVIHECRNLTVAKALFLKLPRTVRNGFGIF